ncbi:uncharacterized protein LOC124816271 [Hydra vulgaris]|uniref:uncharacterized protein LOC124816271 n=1 Tax=Hydra vulgaris TaxID=6087 RepID=UPI001F5E610F|nr:uncharacterized protein LOC124816271 [Hydra vulgaris]
MERINQDSIFGSEVARIADSDLVFLDETGFNKHTVRSYGYSPKDTKAYLTVPANKEQNVSLMCLSSNLGVECYQYKSGAYNTQSFIDFINNKLVPFFAVNPNKILIQDNAKFHKAAAVLQLLREKNITHKFLVPYFPELNPIEEFFSMLKSNFKSTRNANTDMTVEETLEYILSPENNYSQQRSGDKITPTKKLIACTISHQTAKCSGLGSCPENCIMFAVKKPWIDGGYEDKILTDPFIRKHITDLINSWESLKKSKCKNSKEAGKARQDFKKKGNKVFWIAKPNIQDILKKTSLNKVSYRTDMKFLRDQKARRKLTLGKKDKLYNRRVEKREQRRLKHPQLVHSVEQFSQKDDLTTELQFSSETSDTSTSMDSDCSFDFEQPGPSNDTSQLAKNFVQDIAMTSVSKNISSRDLLHVCTDLVVNSGGNVENFLLSQSTIWRAQKKTIHQNAAQHKREVKKAGEKALFPIIAHFDGKIIEDFTNGKKEKRDRFVVSVNIDGDIKLLGIPAMEHGTGAAQYEALNNVLEDYGICDDVKGLCFDTTASNTGRHSGTNTRFSQRQESILLELACRRHIYELHLKHFWEQITSGKTAAPENLMFKRFQTNWNCIKKTVDPSNLIRFDINSISNTFLATQIEETIQFCKDALKTDIVPRGDYRELLELTLMYLHPEKFFKVRAPGCVSHARFMSKTIYYLKIQILSTHLPYDLTVSQRKELKAMAEFISIFYSVWFLRTSLPSGAPF